MTDFLLFFGYFVLSGIIAICFLEILDNQKNGIVRILKRVLIAAASLSQGYFAAVIITSVIMSLDDFFTQITKIPFGYTDFTIAMGIFGGLFYILYMDKYFIMKQSLQASSNKSDPKKLLECNEIEQFLHSIKPNMKVIFFEYTDKVSSFGAHISQFSNPKEIYLGKELNELTTISEKQFVIAHELSHSKKFMINMAIVFTVFFLLLTYVGGFIQIYLGNQILFIILQILIFFISVMLLHYIQWGEEYRADFEGVKLTNNPQSAVDFFTTAIAYEKRVTGREQSKDFGFLNYFELDHPLTKDRLEKIQLATK